MRKKIILFNPRSSAHKPRIPNSVLQVAASVMNEYDVIFVDGNLEQDPLAVMLNYFSTQDIFCLGVTVMPGPQLKQAIAVTRRVKELHPVTRIVWGGYFPSNQPAAVLNSGLVDAIINGPGDRAFPLLLQGWAVNRVDYAAIPNLIYLQDGKPTKTRKDELYNQDELPPLPYDKLNEYYPIKRYLGKTFLGNETIAYHSSIGCPFTCSFCGIVPIYNARWKGKSADNIYADLKKIKENYGGDSIEFHDNNFFVSEKRTVEFSRLMLNEGMNWWGEGRIDTIDKYKDDSLKIMRDSGCKMIFLGAESGNDEILKKMDKGGTQTGDQIKRFAERMARFDIIPELSFVLGTPAESSSKVARQIDEEIRFIREVKKINPEAEIIIYVYSPVPTEGSEMYEEVKKSGFHFPRQLDEWISPAWENFDLRKNPLTPWLTPAMVNKIKNFETVLNGYFPTVSDTRIRGGKKRFIRVMSSIRYKSGFYTRPYEIKALHKLWKYRQPEIEGFYAE